MKNNIKRITTMFLVFSMVFSFAACGKKDTGSQTDTKSSGSADDDFFGASEEYVGNNTQTSSGSGTQTSSGKGSGSGTQSLKAFLKTIPSSAKGKTITVFNWNPSREYTGAPKVIDNFKKETGIEIKWISANFDNYLTQLTNLVASDQSPDLVRLRDPNPVGLTNMQDLNKVGFDFSDAIWDKQVMGDYTYNGKCFGVSVKGTHIASPEAMLYNKALIKKYDLDDPYKLWKNGKWTVNKFIELCNDFKKLAKAEYSFTGGIDEYQSFFGYSGPIEYQNGKFVNIINQPDFVKRTQEMCDYLNTSKIFNYRWQTEAFDRGECLFFASTMVLARRMNAYFSTLKNAGSLAVVPYPSENGKTETVMFGEYEAYGIPKGSKNAEIAPYFLRYFLARENYDIDSFFCNDQAVEVCDFLMAVPTRKWRAGFGEHRFYGGVQSDIKVDIGTATGAQTVSVLNKYASVISKRADDYNKLISEF